MTENDYILATNLTKIRIALDVLRGVYEGPGRGISPSKFGNARRCLSEIEATLTKLVKTDEISDQR